MTSNRICSAGFGDEWAYYCQPNPGDPLQPMSIVLFNRLQKPAEVERSLNQLEQLAQNALRGPVPALFSISQQKVGELTVHTLSTPQGGINWAIADGRFCLAT